jgi:DNA-binding response OmpR family regulator
MVNNRVLIVDGHVNSRSRISDALKSRGIQTVDTGVEKEALTMLKSGSYNLVYFDLDNLDMDLTCLQQTRNTWLETVIIFHDQQPTLERVMAALKLGTSDYLVGPITPLEIVVAIARALRKREEHLLRVTKYLGNALESYFSNSRTENGTVNGTTVEHEKSLMVGDFLLDRAARMLTIGGSDEKSVQLTKNETDILAALMSRPGNVLSSKNILRIAWGYDTDNIDASTVIRPSISRLRRKLAGTHNAASMIQTVRGVGYMLIPNPASDTQE